MSHPAYAAFFPGGVGLTTAVSINEAFLAATGLGDALIMGERLLKNNGAYIGARTNGGNTIGAVIVGACPIVYVNFFNELVAICANYSGDGVDNSRTINANNSKVVALYNSLKRKDLTSHEIVQRLMNELGNGAQAWKQMTEQLYPIGDGQAIALEHKAVRAIEQRQVPQSGVYKKGGGKKRKHKHSDKHKRKGKKE